MKFGKLDIAWLAAVIGLGFGWFWLGGQCQRVIAGTMPDTNAGCLRAETDKRELEEHTAATAENEPLNAPIAPYVDIATLDVAEVFKKSQTFNGAMAPIKAKLEGWNTRLPENHPLAIESTRLYAETYQRLVEIVTRICKAKNIGLAIRAKLESNGIIVEGSSVLQLSDRPVVYSDVPDLTDEVIAELDRYDQGMKAQSAADVDGPWVDRPGQQTELLLRYKKLWTTPIVELSNAMLATFLRQRIALRLVVPEAQKRLDSAFVDGTELYDKELSESLHKAITTK